VYAAEPDGDSTAVARGHQRLARALTAQRLDFREIGRLLLDVDAALKTACEAGIERARNGRDDLARLRSIRRRAYGRQGE
jgi:hypothetical protein